MKHVEMTPQERAALETMLQLLVTGTTIAELWHLEEQTQSTIVGPTNLAKLVHGPRLALEYTQAAERLGLGAEARRLVATQLLSLDEHAVGPTASTGRRPDGFEELRSLLQGWLS